MVLATVACVAHRPLVPAVASDLPADAVPADVATNTAPPLVIRDAVAAPEPTTSAWQRYLATADTATPSVSQEFELTDPEQRVIGELTVLKTRGDNTFSDIARAFALGYDELAVANPGIDPWLPGDDTPVLLPTRFVLPDAPRDGIVLNIAAKRLFYFPKVAAGESARVITYPIGIGRVGWATPIGSSRVIAKAENPTWYVPWSVREEHRAMGDPLPAVVPPGPDNPLGHRVLKLAMDGYLIHGTNQPYGVGMRVSHGCVRLYPEHIEALYRAVAIGTPVHIVNQPVLAAWHDDTLVVQAFPRLEDDERSATSINAEVLAVVDRVENARRRSAAAQRLGDVVAEASGLATVIADGAGKPPRQRWPQLVANTVVVDNPLSDAELEELMTLADDAASSKPATGE